MEWSQEDFASSRTEGLQEKIHDRYFEMDWVRFDEVQRCWEVSMCDDRPGPSGKRDARLVVDGVYAYSIEGKDKTRAAWDILNVMKYDGKNSVLRIKGCIWSTIVLSVMPAFCVTLEPAVSGRSRAARQEHG